MQLTYEQRIKIALSDLVNLANSRTLLKGHFSLVAKRHGVKVTDIKNAYRNR